MNGSALDKAEEMFRKVSRIRLDLLPRRAAADYRAERESANAPAVDRRRQHGAEQWAFIEFVDVRTPAAAPASSQRRQSGEEQSARIESEHDRFNAIDSGAMMVQLLRLAKVVSYEQVCVAQHHSRISNGTVPQSLMQIGFITKELLETAGTMQIQIQTGELSVVEAKSVLAAQKQLHDAFPETPVHQIKSSTPILSKRMKKAINKIFDAAPLQTPLNTVSNAGGWSDAEPAGDFR